jgi:hypothetical protein
MVKRAANAFIAVLKSGQIHFRAAAEAGHSPGLALTISLALY